MITFRQFIDESMNDRGILKAIFVVGIPGAGKSYTISKIKGAIQPQIINTDRATEYLTKKLGIESGEENWSIFKDDAHRVTVAHLANCLNGMLPLFVDGTSSDVSNILARAGILESVGYDVGVVFVDTKLEVAVDRAKARGEAIGRHVPAEFIKKVHDLSQENKAYLKSKFQFFKEISNDPGELTDEAILTLFKSVSSFYDAPVQNPVGQRTLKKLKEEKQKYLVPEVYSADALKKKAEGWYRSHR